MFKQALRKSIKPTISSLIADDASDDTRISANTTNITTLTNNSRRRNPGNMASGTNFDGGFDVEIASQAFTTFMWRIPSSGTTIDASRTLSIAISAVTVSDIFDACGMVNGGDFIDVVLINEGTAGAEDQDVSLGTTNSDVVLLGNMRVETAAVQSSSDGAPVSSGSGHFRLTRSTSASDAKLYVVRMS